MAFKLERLVKWIVRRGVKGPQGVPIADRNTNRYFRYSKTGVRIKKALAGVSI